MAKLEASIDKYGKECTRQNEDMIRWKKRYADALKALENFQKEIESNVSIFRKIINVISLISNSLLFHRNM